MFRDSFESTVSADKVVHSVWAISEGAHLISVDGEVIAYAVLDILAKPIFGFWLLYAHGATDDNVEVNGFWAYGLAREGTVRLDDDDGA